MADKTTFEAALRGLEEAVERLESGELPLEEALLCYERGVKHALLCRKRLQQIETRVQMLVRDRDGELRVTAMDESP